MAGQHGADLREVARAQLLDLGASDLTALAEAGELEPCYEQEPMLERALESLAARRNVLLLGPAGVGKTCVLHEIARRLVQGAVPDALKGKRIFRVSTTAIEAGSMNAGQWGERLKLFVEATIAATDVLVYIDNIWALRDAGRYSGRRESFATFLHGYLSQRQLVMLGESTPENYTFTAGQEGWRGFALADDPSLMSLFTVLRLDPPTPETASQILAHVATDLEALYGLEIERSVVARSVEVTRRFQPYEALPGKAIRLLREAVSAEARLEAPADGRIVQPEAVMAAFSRLTGLPERLFSDSIALPHAEVTAYFAERVVGQPEAVAAVVDLVTLIKAELHDPHRPLGVLLFAGPTGSGKTFLAKTLAAYLFGTEEALVRFDMSEYQYAHTAGDLVRQMTERLRYRHFAVVLFDEVEKAASTVHDLFLQAFDDARLTDPVGNTVDLRNTIMVLTSNLGGSTSVNPGLGFGATHDPDEDRQRRLRAIEGFFRPELLNRLETIVCFRPLDREAMRRIARRELGRALQREGVRRRNILLDFRDSVLDVLLQAGFSERYGARPLQRAIKEQVLVPLARRLAAAPSTSDLVLELYAAADHIATHVIDLPRPTAPAEPRRRPRVVERSRSLRQLEADIASLKRRLEELRASEWHARLVSRSERLLAELSRPTFWDDHTRARRINSALYHLGRTLERFADLQRRADGLADVPELLRRHDRARQETEIVRFEARVRELSRDLTLAELELLAAESGAPVTRRVLVAVTPVPRRTEDGADDWARALAEMYAGWAQRRGYEANDEAQPEAPERLVVIRGPNVAAMLVGETGLHRRQQQRGAGSLARVWVAPLVRPDGEHGGSAPSRLARAIQAALARREAEQPDRLDQLVRVYRTGAVTSVRDPRTGERTGRLREVLEGELDPFLVAYLTRQAAAEAPQPALELTG